MVRLLKFVLACKLKAFKPSQKTGGFTLIELLVGLILAFLVILPLLGFMVNMLQTDRQEQAKAASEQEIQAALNYMARDLDQAVHVYDGYALGGAGGSQIAAGLPQVTNGVPVLVFWKRKFLPGAITVGSGKDDAFIYALVAYYLIKDSNCSTTSNWSCTARIGRIELQGPATQRGIDPNQYQQKISLFNLSPTDPTLAAASFEQKMNAWPNSATPSYNRNDQPEILLDYIDQTPEPAIPERLTASCPTTGRSMPRPDVTDAISSQPGFDPQTIAYPYRQVPSAAAMTQAFSGQLSSFYACVDTNQNLSQVVKVFVRGNALARTRKKTAPPTYVDSQSSYFPSASIQVKNRGFFGDSQNQ